MSDVHDQIDAACDARNSEALIVLLQTCPDLMNRDYFEAGTLLHEASHRNMIAAIRYIHSQGVDVNIVGRLADCPIHQAVEGGNIEAVDTLLELGADINAGAGNSPVPLISAVFTGNLKMVGQLVARGADVNASYVNWYGQERRALDFAHLAKDVRMIELLQSFGATNGPEGKRTPTVTVDRRWARLSTYVDRRNVKAAMTYALEHPELIKSQSPDEVLLHMAAENNIPELVEFCIGQGAKVDAFDGALERTPLQRAAVKGSLDSARLLLENNADPNCGAGMRPTPFFEAVAEGHLQIAALMLKFGADVNAGFMRSSGSPRNTLEFVERQRKDKDTCQWLIERGATIPTITDLVNKYPDLAASLCRDALQGSNYVEVAQASTTAIQRKPSSGLYYQRGVAFDMQGKLSEAMADFDQAIVLDENDFQALYSRSLVHRKMENWKAAMDDLTAAERINDGDFIVANGLANLFATIPDETLRDGQRAVTLATRACELSGWEDSICLRTLAAAYRLTGEFEKAEEAEQDAVSCQEVDPFSVILASRARSG